MWLFQSGEGLSLLAALSWGAAIVCFKFVGDTMPPLALNLFKNVFGLLAIALTLLWVNGPTWPFAESDAVWLLLSSGVLGIAIADTLLFQSLNILGASRSAIIDCLYSPFTVLFSFLILDESLSLFTALGALCILAGILVAGLKSSQERLPMRRLIEGALLGVVSMALMAMGLVMAKPVIDAYPVLWTISLRMGAGTVALVLVTSLRKEWRREVRLAFTPNKVWGIALLGTFLGAYLSLIFWLAGVKATQVMTAAILNQMSTLFVVLFAAWFLGEALSLKKGVAVVLGVAGSVLALL